MPLTSRKVAHIAAKYGKVFAGRAQPVNLTLRHADGTTSVLTVNALWKPQTDSDPTREGSSHHTQEIGTSADILGIFQMQDVTLAQLHACLYATLPAGSPGAQFSSKYVLTAIDVRGIPPGGDRFITEWVRQ